jgi:hypothetical protein
MPKVFGYDIDRLSADDIAEKTRFTQLEVLPLLEGLLEVLDNIDSTHYSRRLELNTYYLEAGLFAYLLFKRIYKGRVEALDLSDPGLDKSHSLNMIHFWAQPAAFYHLFEKLKESCYYQRKPFKEIFRCRIPKTILEK